MLAVLTDHRDKEISNSHKSQMNFLWEKARSIEKARNSVEFKKLYQSKEDGLCFRVEGRDVTLQLKQMLPKYLAQIEDITGHVIGIRQRKYIENYIANNRVVGLSSYESATNRREFNIKRHDLREEWEQKTGQEWPRYAKNVVINGKIVRNAGAYYDAHHIIENSYGGPPMWWNIHPASFPDEHQNGIHGKGRIASQIFV